ncbi:hypothetical protein [Streptomyces hainanensis]|uniref:Uncharacterized protein n=1 Tax=Streptomyces hainanensis TaxID=402648 RepID=A0A4R4TD85_9ACTN|nr:hypothetical protein [Streptomyces hainanensis]TDC75488.1 hypothetical protein E1283_12250 [Streptomyces hainanensis]
MSAPPEPALDVRLARRRTARRVGGLLVAADLVAQSAFAGRQLPVGAVTGVLGGGYLPWPLRTERRSG